MFVMKLYNIRSRRHYFREPGSHIKLGNVHRVAGSQKMRFSYLLSERDDSIHMALGMNYPALQDK